VSSSYISPSGGLGGSRYGQDIHRKNLSKGNVSNVLGDLNVGSGSYGPGGSRSHSIYSNYANLKRENGQVSPRKRRNLTTLSISADTVRNFQNSVSNDF
jgi:hypothetical protein